MKKIKNKLKSVFTKKINLKNKLNIFVTVFAIIIVASSIFAIGQKFQPGETLNPGCTPGEENCTVDIQITNNQSGSGEVVAFSVSRLDYRGYSAFLDFDNEFVDTDNAFSGHTFTAPVAGKYYLSWSFTKNAYSNSGTNNDVMLKVYKNGVYLNQAWSGEEAGNIDTASNSIIVDLAVNDEITFKAYSDGNRYMHMGGRAPGITASGFLLTGGAATAANESLPACGNNQIIVYSQSSNMWECKDGVDANGASVLKSYSKDFDCTLGGQFTDGETSFKFNLGYGTYKCLYMFHVGEVYSQSADKVYTCESKGLRDASGIKIPLIWKKDSTTWHKMWDKARSIASYGKFVFFGNAGDYNAHYFMGIDLLYHYTQPYKVYKDYGAYNYNSWQEPAYKNGQRSDYGQNGFVVCELGDMVAEKGSVVYVEGGSGVGSGVEIVKEVEFNGSSVSGNNWKTVLEYVVEKDGVYQVNMSATPNSSSGDSAPYYSISLGSNNYATYAYGPTFNGTSLTKTAILYEGDIIKVGIKGANNQYHEVHTGYAEVIRFEANSDNSVIRKYVDETSNRSFDNVYTNNTGSEIEVIVETNVTTTSTQYYGLIAVVDSKEIESGLVTGSGLPNQKISFIVPDGATYSLKKHSYNAQYVVLKKWLELKKN